MDTASRELVDWLQNHAHPAAVMTQPPDRMTGRSGIGCYCYDMVPLSSLRERGRLIQEVALRYVITAWDADMEAEAGTDILSRIAFALQSSPDYELESYGLPFEAWTAFGIAPRPSLVVKVRIRHEQPIREAPPVKETIIPLGIKGNGQTVGAD
jgi:hypothetical protein